MQFIPVDQRVANMQVAGKNNLLFVCVNVIDSRLEYATFWEKVGEELERVPNMDSMALLVSRLRSREAAQKP